MKKQKVIWVSMVLALALGSFAPLGLFASKAEAKNYRNRKSFSVTGNGANADFSTTASGVYSTSSTLYRRLAFPGLKMADPFSFRVFKQKNTNQNFGQESWDTADHYFITDGNLWFHYGYNATYEGLTTYSDYSTGNFRYLSYYGGTKKKKRKNSAYKTYEFAVSGTESDADTTATESGSTTTYYYRKISVPEIKLENLVDYRLYSRNSASQGYTDESWMIETDDFFVADGALYVAYGYKNSTPGSTFSSLNNSTFRFFVYSDGKMKKDRLTKQYVKRYTFSVPSDMASADKVTSYTDSDGYVFKEYYKKVSIKGAKMADFPNIQVMKKNSFASGFADESWSQAGYAITNGYIWISYGSQVTDPDGVAGDFEATGSGDYQAFSYR